MTLEQRARRKRRPGEQTSKVQAICVQDRAEREEEARWTDRHASGDLRTRTSRTKTKTVDRAARFRQSAYKIELKKKNQSPASGSACLRNPTDRIELGARINTTAQATTSDALRAVMEEPGNVDTSTIRNIPIQTG